MPTIIFPSDAATVVFIVILVVWSLSEAIGGVIVPALRRGGERVHRRRTSANVLLEWIAVFVVSLFLAAKQIAMLPTWSYYGGIVLMLMGMVIRQWAMAALGRYFSPVLGVQQKQTVVDTGPYRFVRHPSYTGVLLIQVGLGLALQSWGAVLIAVVLFGLAFGYRMRVEEKVLVAELGENYTSYKSRTKKRLIPFIM
jgi:protein-S-isoprenylcysteine O-methyltransferase Ste14